MYNEYDENPVQKTLHRKKKKRLKRKIKVCLFVLGAFLMGALEMKGVLKVKTINVTGLEFLSQDQVLSSLSIDKSSYYLFMSKKSVTKEVEQIPTVKSAKVNCDLVGNIKIDVQEASPIAYTIMNKAVYEVNELGNVIEVTDKERISLLKSYPQLHDFTSVEVLKSFAKQFKDVPTLMQNEMSDIILSPKKTDPTLLKCILKNKKVIQIRIEDLGYRLSEDQFNYEAYKVGFKNVCTFKFEGKYLYLEDCKK